MEEIFPVLNVNMLGRFSITYGNQSISFKRNTTTKSLQLLQILLHSPNGITRTQLLEDLYAHEELSNTSNNLRVTIFRLKKQLMDAGLPEYNYIQIENNVYSWNSPMKTEIDAINFEKLITTAKLESNEKKKISIFYQALNMYRGEFLPALSSEDWVIINSVKYKKLYTYAFLQVCDYLKKEHEYEELLNLSSKAIKIYPFEEWQEIKISALIALNRYKEAYRYYEETAKLFFEELGISPSERMLSHFKTMSNQLCHQYKNTTDIQLELIENDYEKGAFYCNLPSFRDCFRFIRRMIERSEQSAYVVVCSLTDGYGHPLEQKEKLEVLSQNLHKSIKNSIRRGDCFSKYSPTQFLILLIVENEDICQLIYNRILTHFIQQNKSWKNNIEYSVFPVNGATSK